MKRTHLLLTLPMLLGLIGSVSHAALISVDFIYSGLNGGGPSTPYSGDTTVTGTLNINVAGEVYTGQVGAWNAVNVGYNNSNTSSASQTTIRDGTGTLTTVTFSMGRATTSGASGGSWRNDYVSTIGGNLREEQSYLYYPALTDNHFNWELAGLTPNAHYRMTFFGNGANTFTNIANSVAGVADTEGDWNWTDITANGSGVILGNLLTTGNNQVFGLYGLQLESIPEPSVLGLLGLTSLGLIRRRRS